MLRSCQLGRWFAIVLSLCVWVVIVAALMNITGCVRAESRFEWSPSGGGRGRQAFWGPEATTEDPKSREPISLYICAFHDTGTRWDRTVDVFECEPE